MLGAFQQAAKAVMYKEEGTIVPLYRFLMILWNLSTTHMRL